MAHLYYLDHVFGTLDNAWEKTIPPFLKEKLLLANAGLTSLEGFPSLPHLKRLVLSHNRISGGLEHLVQAGLKSLEDLDLSNKRIQVLEDLVPLLQFSLEYRARVFDIIKSLEFLDKMDVEGGERLESDDEDEGEEVDSENERCGGC